MLIPLQRKKILEVFMSDPAKEIHLREISRLSKVSLNNVNSTLRQFVKEGLFKRREISNMSFFKPNLDSEDLLKLFEYIELKRKRVFYNKNKSIARLLEKYTANVIELSKRQIQIVVLFGSVARGEWGKGSDIDILAVSSNKDSDASNILNKAKIDVSPLLEIRPVSTTTEKFTEGLRKKTEFYCELWSDRIVLYNESLFWKLVREGNE